MNGLHHVTAVSAIIADNLEFYTNILGLRLVKKSVNQDDVSAYHLFYADKLGSPGTDMTFFDWPDMGPNIRGTDSITGTAFRVQSRSALDFWAARLDDFNVTRGRVEIFSGREVLPFEDAEGQQLYLVNDNGYEFEGEIWPHAEIPDEFALRGFYSVLFSVAAIDQLNMILTQLMNFEEITRATWIDQDTEAVIYTTKSGGGPGTEVWVMVQPGLARGRLGAGGTHHVAFRVADFDEQKRWHNHLTQAGLSISGLIDRFWFRSIYFRVSNGILFEIATDGPGFAVDEDPEALGETLVLPPFLEGRREEIEAGLTPIGG
ncbi:MAG: ring-cleaving dioxygenase [Anaerolineales bacterium]|nr:ring-cleaving dioxygenase [Anaerolineales bacterium]